MNALVCTDVPSGASRGSGPFCGLDLLRGVLDSLHVISYYYFSLVLVFKNYRKSQDFEPSWEGNYSSQGTQTYSPSSKDELQ